jgi:esterase
MREKLNYKEYGSGEPVIILHGFLGMLDNWHSFAKKLSESYRVITVDQRNHGRSFHSDDFDYKIMSQDLYQFIETLELDSVKLIGHSMGGKTVMKLLSEHSSLVDKAVIVDIAPKQYNGGHEAILEALSALDLTTIDKRSEAQDILTEKLGNPSVVQFLLKNLNRNPDQSYEWKANVKLLHEKYKEVSAEIKFDTPCEVPTLFIKGSNSNYITDDDRSDIEAVFNHSQIIEIEGAGHWVHAEKPVELLGEVTHFYKD